MSGYLRPGGDGRLYTKRYERLRIGAAGPMDDIWNRNGVAVIVSCGVAAWMGILDPIAVAPRPDAMAGSGAAPSANEVVNVLAAMMRPHLDAVVTEYG